MAATDSGTLSSPNLPPDDLGTYTMGGYTPIAMPTAVMTSTRRHRPSLDYTNSGYGLGASVLRLPDCAGCPARCLAAVNTDFELV